LGADAFRIRVRIMRYRRQATGTRLKLILMFLADRGIAASAPDHYAVLILVARTQSIGVRSRARKRNAGSYRESEEKSKAGFTDGQPFPNKQLVGSLLAIVSFDCACDSVAARFQLRNRREGRRTCSTHRSYRAIQLRRAGRPRRSRLDNKVLDLRVR
jgi:hypothetical protein